LAWTICMYESKVRRLERTVAQIAVQPLGAAGRGGIWLQVHPLANRRDVNSIGYVSGLAQTRAKCVRNTDHPALLRMKKSRSTFSGTGHAVCKARPSVCQRTGLHAKDHHKRARLLWFARVIAPCRTPVHGVVSQRF
jgi:hypothetical protein